MVREVHRLHRKKPIVELVLNAREMQDICALDKHDGYGESNQAASVQLSNVRQKFTLRTSYEDMPCHSISDIRWRYESPLMCYALLIYISDHAVHHDPSHGQCKETARNGDCGK